MVTTHDDELQQQEWETLYDQLIHLFAHFGTSDAYGNGDYYIVEDNDGEAEQIVKIFNLLLVNPGLVTEIQRSMAGLDLEWEVKLKLETFDPRYTGKDESVTIFKNRVEEHWDKQKLQRELHDAYAWTN